MRIPLACCILSCVDVVLYGVFFSSLPPLFRSRFGHRLFFILSFSCGYFVLSPRFRFRYLLRLVWHVICISIPTYADLTFLLEVYELFQLLYHYLASVLICFPPKVIFRSRVWSLSCDHGLHCGDELM